MYLVHRKVTFYYLTNWSFNSMTNSRIILYLSSINDSISFVNSAITMHTALLWNRGVPKEKIVFLARGVCDFSIGSASVAIIENFINLINSELFLHETIAAWWQCWVFFKMNSAFVTAIVFKDLSNTDWRFIRLITLQILYVFGSINVMLLYNIVLRWLSILFWLN